MRAGVLAFLLMAACAPATLKPVPDSAGPPQATVRQSLTLQGKAHSFLSVTRTLEPVIEAECRARTRAVPCDFQLVIDDRPGQGPNAFQTLDAQGRPVIGFTPALIVMAANADELAFVMAHEAAHHILGHLARQRADARLGAAAFGRLAGLVGGSDQTVEEVARIGAAVGARSYSKTYELEADRLGARIARRAGFDPIRGAAFFARVPDPGDRFLGSHPPNAARMEAVRRAVQ